MKRWRDKEDFKATVHAWAEKLDVEVHSLALRPMRAKWASCSTAGNLNFNTELLVMDRELGEYVIVHELLHFSVPNHGKLWKSLMRAHVGDYEALDARLRKKASFALDTVMENATSYLPKSKSRTPRRLEGKDFE